MIQRLQRMTSLEILLTLTVLASLIVVGIRYTIVSHRDLRLAQAVKQIQQITNASYQWLEGQHQIDFSGVPVGTTISTAQLLKHQGLYHKTALQNPWGGTIIITAGDDPSHVKITLNNIPIIACRTLNQQLSPINHLPTACKPTQPTQFTGEF